jgi:hypothetical protein
MNKVNYERKAVLREVKAGDLFVDEGDQMNILCNHEDGSREIDNWYMVCLNDGIVVDRWTEKPTLSMLADEYTYFGSDCEINISN